MCQSILIALHLWSYHFGTVPNNNTFGAGLECDRGSYTINVGDYRNSFNENTAYLALSKEWHTGSFGYGGYLGVGTGYNEPILAGLEVSYTHNQVYRVIFVPDPRTPTLHLMVSFKP